MGGLQFNKVEEGPSGWQLTDHILSTLLMTCLANVNNQDCFYVTIRLFNLLTLSATGYDWVFGIEATIDGFVLQFSMNDND